MPEGGGLGQGVLVYFYRSLPLGTLTRPFTLGVPSFNESSEWSRMPQVVEMSGGMENSLEIHVPLTPSSTQLKYCERQSGCCFCISPREGCKPRLRRGQQEISVTKIITTKNCNMYLGTDFTKDMQELYIENHKTQRTEIEQDPKKWRGI